MNSITTNTIVDPNKQQPFLGTSLAFLQGASKEMIIGICRAIMGETLYNLTSTRGVCLCGGQFNNTLDLIATGFIFFNGELYFFSGQSGMNAYSNVPVFIDAFNFVSPDPITYSDGSTGSVHQQRRLTVADQVSGTGLFDLSTLLYVPAHNGTAVATSTTATSGSSATPIAGATYTTPHAATGINRKFKITFTSDLLITLTAGQEGCTLEIYNSTASAVIATQLMLNYPTAISLFSMPLAIQCVVPSVGGNVTIIARITRYASDVTVANGNFIVEEVF